MRNRSSIRRDQTKGSSGTSTNGKSEPAVVSLIARYEKLN
jgi:hypothetical protein